MAKETPHRKRHRRKERAIATSLSEAIRIANNLLQRDAEAVRKNKPAPLTTLEAQAIVRLIKDANLTLSSLLEGGTGGRRGRPA
jgi:hypothetical protein